MKRPLCQWNTAYHDNITIRSHWGLKTSQKVGFTIDSRYPSDHIEVVVQRPPELSVSSLQVSLHPLCSVSRWSRFQSPVRSHGGVGPPHQLGSDTKMSRTCHDSNEVLHGTAGATTPGLREPTPLYWPCQLSVSLYVPGQDCMTVAASPLARLLDDTEGGAGTERTFGLLRLSIQCVTGWSTSWLWMTRPR